jgi:hypothetical protein
MPLARTILAGLAWLFLTLVAVQVFLAGVALFGAGTFDGHIGFGYLLAMVPLVVLIACWPARPGRTVVWLSVALLVVTQVQTFLPLFRDDLPVVAALHPVNALAIFWLGLTIARRATALARATSDAPEARQRVNPADRASSAT